VLKQTTEGDVAMAAILEPNFANIVVRGSRREVWISKEGKRRRDREEREKDRERDSTRTHSRSVPIYNILIRRTSCLWIQNYIAKIRWL